MIKLNDGELLDILPAQLKYDTDMICLSYALKMAIRSLLAYERQTMTQNFVDLLPDHILDVLAVELRSPYYRQDMEIETKRKIIKSTLVWHTKAGTTSAVSEMINVLFGDGEVIEWYDFDEGEKTPGMFDIVTGARMTEGIVEFFMQVIERVKNERSHLRRVLIERDVNITPRIGTGAIFTPGATISNNQAEREEAVSPKESAAGGSYTVPREVVTNNVPERSGEIGVMEGVAAAAFSIPTILVVNDPGKFADERADVAARAGAGLSAYPRLVVTNVKEERESRVKVKDSGAVGTTTYPKNLIQSGSQNKERKVDLVASGGVGYVSSAHLNITNHPRGEEEETAVLAATSGAIAYPKTIIQNGGKTHGAI